MTTTVTADEAEAHLRDLLARVEDGDEVIIARDGQPIARLVPSPGPVPGRRKLGWAKELYGPLPEDWGAPMTEEELALWYDAPIFPEDTEDTTNGRGRHEWPAGFVELENGVVVAPSGIRLGTGRAEFGPLRAYWEKPVPPGSESSAQDESRE